MPGLIPFLPTPPQPQPHSTQTTSHSARPNILDTDQGATRGSSQQAPIELDSDSDSAPTSERQNTTTQSQSSQQNRNPPFDQQAWNWADLPTPNSSGPQQALPSFSALAANLGLASGDASTVNSASFLNLPPHTPAREPNSDDFLDAIADGNFSSPSSYPPSAQPSSVSQLPNGSSFRNQLASSGAPPQSTRALDSLRTFVANITQNTNGLAPRTGRPAPRPSSQEEEVEESLFVSSDNETDNMPVQTRRRASTAMLASDHEQDEPAPTNTRKRPAPATSRGAPASNKRRRSSQTSTTRTRATPRREAAPKVEDEEDVFGEKDGSKGKEKDDAGGDVIDLAATNEVPQEMVIPKEDKRIKLSAFQCVICMDDVTSLTVTHCGTCWQKSCLPCLEKGF